MILDEKLEKVFFEFMDTSHKYRKKGMDEFRLKAFKEVVRSLLIEKPEEPENKLNNF